MDLREKSWPIKLTTLILVLAMAILLIGCPKKPVVKLEEKLAKLNVQIKALEEELSKTQAALAIAEARTNALEAQRKDLEKELEKVKAALAAAQAKVAEAEQERIALEKQL